MSISFHPALAPLVGKDVGDVVGILVGGEVGDIVGENVGKDVAVLIGILEYCVLDASFLLIMSIECNAKLVIREA